MGEDTQSQEWDISDLKMQINDLLFRWIPEHTTIGEMNEISMRWFEEIAILKGIRQND